MCRSQRVPDVLAHGIPNGPWGGREMICRDGFCLSSAGCGWACGIGRPADRVPRPQKAVNTRVAQFTLFRLGAPSTLRFWWCWVCKRHPRCGRSDLKDVASSSDCERSSRLHLQAARLTASSILRLSAAATSVIESSQEGPINPLTCLDLSWGGKQTQALRYFGHA